MHLATLVRLVACAALLAHGCSKDGAKQERKTQALWALAPADTTVGVVVAEGTATKLLAASAAITKTVADIPGGAEAMAKLREEMRREMEIDIFDPTQLAKYGVDAAKGAAFFYTKDRKSAMVMPIGNRETFIKAVNMKTETKDGLTVDVDDSGKGHCAEMKGHYICTDSFELLRAVGASDAVAKRIAALPGSLRGDVEVWADLRAIDEEIPWQSHFADAGILSVAAQLGSGAMTIRGHLQTKPQGTIAPALAKTTNELAKAIAKESPAGVTRVSLPLAAIIPMEEAASELAPLAMIGGIDVKKDLLENLTGELVFYSLGGKTMEIIIEVGMQDGTRLKAMVAGLCALGGQQVPQLGLAMKDDRCTAIIDPKALGAEMADLKMDGPVELAIHSDKRAVIIRIGLGKRGEPGKVATNDLARDLASGSWNFALWGTGMTVDPSLAEISAAAKENELGEFEGYLRAALYGIAHVSELGTGFSVRDDGVHAVLHLATHFGNPDNVLTEYQAIVRRMLDGDAKAAADLEALAKRSPGTPLARSADAGQGGLFMGSGAGLGIASAIAIPAFSNYVDKSKEAEAQQFLRKLGEGGRVFYLESPEKSATPQPAHFPPESVGPTPPIGACCEQGGQCAPNPEQWNHPTWVALTFSIDDPHYYSYEYQVVDKNKEARIRAIGDLNCDGQRDVFESTLLVSEQGEVTLSPVEKRLPID